MKTSAKSHTICTIDLYPIIHDVILSSVNENVSEIGIGNEKSTCTHTHTSWVGMVWPVNLIYSIECNKFVIALRFCGVVFYGLLSNQIDMTQFMCTCTTQESAIAL